MADFKAKIIYIYSIISKQIMHSDKIKAKSCLKCIFQNATFPPFSKTWPCSLTYIRENQCRAEMVEEREKRRWLLNSSSPCCDAQAEQGGAHWDARAMLPGRTPVPVLALYHRKPFLLLKLGRSWNIWWNSPTGHLCDKWIKQDKVMLTAIGLCMSRIRTRRHRCFIHFLNITLSSQIVLTVIYSFRFWSNNRNSLKKNQFEKLQHRYTS